MERLIDNPMPMPPGLVGYADGSVVRCCSTCPTVRAAHRSSWAGLVVAVSRQDEEKEDEQTPDSHIAEPTPALRQGQALARGDLGLEGGAVAA